MATLLVTTTQHSTRCDVTNTWEKVGNHQLYEVRTGTGFRPNENTKLPFRIVRTCSEGQPKTHYVLLQVTKGYKEQKFAILKATRTHRGL